eukprot:TRINITY_DN13083_c0_g3_i1.p1 TRINITY_DN13083_c0_g3~~TRINITY_DN13083_c0_g3_i1.p1  ORF type:complete len:352 (+),score=63.93 TRINITY_DN13083_c0_g3_i1:1158-2213(+)
MGGSSSHAQQPPPATAPLAPGGARQHELQEDPFLTAGRATSSNANPAAKAKAAPQRKLVNELKKAGPDRHQLGIMLMFGLYLPCLLFILLLVAFTYTSHFMPSLPWLVAAIGGSFLFVGSWPATHIHMRSSKLHWIPLLSSVLALSLGVFVGRMNSAVIEPWVHAQYLNHYKDVVPDESPAGVMDAGVIEFAAGSKLDVGSSAGFYVWPNTYCAAPIMVEGSSAADENSKAVGFWAVGVNCCSPRGSFDCDSAADKKASAGLRVQSHSRGVAVGHDVGKFFNKAVNMAAASYGLRVAKPPVLVAWHRDPSAIAGDWLITANIVFGVLVGVTLILCCGCSWPMVKYGQIAQD